MGNIPIRFGLHDQGRGSVREGGEQAGDPWLVGVAGQHMRPDERTVGDGQGHVEPPERLHREGDVADVAARPAHVLGQGHPEQARLHEGNRGGGVKGAARCRPQHVGTCMLAQGSGHSFGKAALVIGELSSHRVASRGRPRPRSAMMLRWISLVPAKIRADLLYQ